MTMQTQSQGHTSKSWDSVVGGYGCPSDCFLVKIRIFIVYNSEDTLYMLIVIALIVYRLRRSVVHKIIQYEKMLL